MAKVKTKTTARPMQADHVSLEEFRENPQNPSRATNEEIDRLAGKIERNPIGLKAMRIAYVRANGQPNTVISGNKRLRVLKRLYGEAGRVPSEWFVDVTDMTEAQRREFILNANISDGSWDYDLLLSQYEREELLQVGFAKELLDSIDGSMIDAICDFGEETGERKKKEESENGTIVIHLPGELMGKWRSYNRINGTDRIVGFIKGELLRMADPQVVDPESEEL